MLKQVIARLFCVFTVLLLLNGLAYTFVHQTKFLKEYSLKDQKVDHSSTIKSILFNENEEEEDDDNFCMIYDDKNNKDFIYNVPFYFIANICYLTFESKAKKEFHSNTDTVSVDNLPTWLKNRQIII